MNDRYEIVSAFLDDEPVDANQLAQALSEPEGRALLLDLLALRHVVQPSSASVESKRRSPLRILVAAAAIVVALLGGYFAGQFRSEAARAAAPSPTRVIEAPGDWQALP